MSLGTLDQTTDDVLEVRRREAEVEKPRPRDFGLLPARGVERQRAGELERDLPRSAPQRSREGQGDRARPVAARAIVGALDRDLVDRPAALRAEVRQTRAELLPRPHRFFFFDPPRGFFAGSGLAAVLSGTDSGPAGLASPAPSPAGAAFSVSALCLERYSAER